MGMYAGYYQISDAELEHLDSWMNKVWWTGKKN